jgi:hypothetical protein
VNFTLFSEKQIYLFNVQLRAKKQTTTPTRSIKGTKNRTKNPLGNKGEKKNERRVSGKRIRKLRMRVDPMKEVLIRRSSTLRKAVML